MGAYRCHGGMDRRLFLLTASEDFSQRGSWQHNPGLLKEWDDREREADSAVSAKPDMGLRFMDCEIMTRGEVRHTTD